MADPRGPSPYLHDARALVTAAASIRAGYGERRACFELRFGDAPPSHGFLVFAGIDAALDAVENGAPSMRELDVVRDLGIVEEDILLRLAEGSLRVDVDAAQNGDVIFPGAPVVTIEGRFAEAVIAASIVRRFVARATTVATRAARRSLAASGAPVFDGSAALVPDGPGAELVARAAFVGGVQGTTASLAGAKLGIPVRATTKDDIADLLSTRVSIPDGWGSSNAERATSLGAHEDEGAILALLQRGPRPGGFVVHDLDAPTELPCRIDLVALENDGQWSPRLGATFDPMVDPGRKLVVRYLDSLGAPVADVAHLVNERIQPPASALVVGAFGVPTPLEAVRSVPITRAAVRDGRRLAMPEPLDHARRRAATALLALPSGVLVLRSPTRYPVGISPGLAALKTKLVAER